MKNVFDTLQERGFIQQCTHEAEIKKLLAEESVSFYIGFDPTADSLTIGHYLTLMAMAHLQQAGHKPIALVGGGTGMVGDPTDKTEMRRVMPRAEIEHNTACFKNQIAKFIHFEDGQALILDNAEWLLELKYVPFIREYGIHFSVNRMLTAESYKTRFEKGLSFFEFNYMLMQSYDFLELYRRHNCKMQLGGNDQWSNIIAGVDLIRRVENTNVYGMTFTLLETSDGQKMGKTQKGAIWLDPSKTTPYELFQYMRNIDDADVHKCLCLLTFLPMEEIKQLTDQKDNAINHAKAVLAYEVTKIIHGEAEAIQAKQAAEALFQGGVMSGSIPTTSITQECLGEGISIITLLETTKLIPSRSEGRRNIQQGGIRINNMRIENIDHQIQQHDFQDGKLMIQKGKKVFHQVILAK